MAALVIPTIGNNRLRVLPVWELKFGSMGGQRARQSAGRLAGGAPLSS